MSKKIIDDVSRYYTEKVIKFGASAKGVDWNSEDSQQLRFIQLLKLLDGVQGACILDYGCGYGSLFDFIQSKHLQYSYCGFDISDEMLKVANAKHSKTDAIWINKLVPDKKFDFVLCSGIFNVKLDSSNENWINYILSELDKINAIAVKGFSFNMLTTYSDATHMRDTLYYANPSFIFDYCKLKFSRNIALLHDYNLYEFTIIVKK